MAVITLNSDNWQDEIVNAGKPALVDFWATWCPHCKRIAPSVDKLAEQYDGKLIIGKVDSDEEPALSRKFSVEYLPTFVLLAADGTLLGQISAPASKAVLEKFITDNITL